MKKLPNRRLSLAALFANLLVVFIIIILGDILPPVVPLFYGKAYGVEQLAPRIALALPPLTAFVICILNIVISLSLKDDFLRKILLGGAIVSTVLSTITVTRIILLVGNL